MSERESPLPLYVQFAHILQLCGLFSLWAGQPQCVWHRSSSFHLQHERLHKTVELLSIYLYIDRKITVMKKQTQLQQPASSSACQKVCTKTQFFGNEPFVMSQKCARTTIRCLSQVSDFSLVWNTVIPGSEHAHWQQCDPLSTVSPLTAGWNRCPLTFPLDRSVSKAALCSRRYYEVKLLIRTN